MITYSMNNDLLLNKSDIKQAVVSITTKLPQQVTKYNTRVHRSDTLQCTHAKVM